MKTLYFWLTSGVSLVSFGATKLSSIISSSIKAKDSFYGLALPEINRFWAINSVAQVTIHLLSDRISDSPNCFLDDNYYNSLREKISIKIKINLGKIINIWWSCPYFPFLSYRRSLGFWFWFWGVTRINMLNVIKV